MCQKKIQIFYLVQYLYHVCKWINADKLNLHQGSDLMVCQAEFFKFSVALEM